MSLKCEKVSLFLYLYFGDTLFWIVLDVLMI